MNMAKKENEITMAEARAFQKSRGSTKRGKAALKRDNCKLNKNVLPKPTTDWVADPGASDVKGIDHPHARVRSHTRKGKKVKSYVRGKKPGVECQPPAP